MKALNIQAQTATSVGVPSTAPPGTGQVARSDSVGATGRARRSGSHSGTAGGSDRREATASDKVSHASAVHNTTANSGSVAPAKKPTPAPKPKKNKTRLTQWVQKYPQETCSMFSQAWTWRWSLPPFLVGAESPPHLHAETVHPEKRTKKKSKFLIGF